MSCSANRSQRTGARGYTAVEVLMAVSLLLIGGSAVVSMQRASVQANLDARKLDMANTIAREWMERLRRDATMWTLPSGSIPTGNNIANAQLLNGHLNDTWYLPEVYNTDSNPDGRSPAFDILGRDLGPARYSQAQFCTHVRLNTLVPNEMIRAEVRVFWPRNLSFTTTPANWCSTTPTNVTGQTGTYHFVQTITAIRVNSQ